MHNTWIKFEALLVLWGLAVFFAATLRERTMLRRLAFYGACLGGTAILILLSGCAAPPAPAPAPAARASVAVKDPRDASVVLMCHSVTFELGDGTGVGEMVAEDVPCCSGFAVRSGPGSAGIQIVTAAHCLTHAAVGQDVAYVTRPQWEHTASAKTMARITRLDPARDRATLSPLRADAADDIAPFALDVGEASALSGSPIYAISGVYDFARVEGHTLARVWGENGSYYVSDLDVKPGWSGSAVLDASGRAVGIVHSCHGSTNHGKTSCVPHSGSFVDLVGLLR